MRFETLRFIADWYFNYGWILATVGGAAIGIYGKLKWKTVALISVAWFVCGALLIMARHA